MRVLLVEPTTLDFGMTVGAYVTQSLAEELRQDHDVVVVVPRPSRLRHAGTIHRSAVDGIPVVVLEIGPPGGPPKALQRVSRAVRHLLSVYPPDLALAGGRETRTIGQQVIDVIGRHCPVITAQVHSDLRLTLCQDSPATESSELRVPLRSHRESDTGDTVGAPICTTRCPGSPRFGVLAGHLPDAAAWMPLRQGLAALTRSDYELFVAADGSAEAYGYWPGAGLIRPVPLRGLTDLDRFFTSIDVLLWPGDATEHLDYALVEAAHRGVPVIAVGRGPMSADCQPWIARQLTGDETAIMGALGGLIDDVRSELVKPAEPGSWPTPADVAGAVMSLAGTGRST